MQKVWRHLEDEVTNFLKSEIKAWSSTTLFHDMLP